jgi:RimJ/RimL family protein N-acetyltransferase
MAMTHSSPRDPSPPGRWQDRGVRHDLVLAAPGVLLVPLGQVHAAGLLAAVDEGMWAGMTTPFPRTLDDALALVGAAHADPTRHAFAVLDEDGAVVGSTSLYEHVPRMARAEIGFTHYARRVWGTVVNPACKLALFTQAFDVWGCERVALRADAANTRSIGAITRLGATPEGVLRSHRVRPDGTRGDTAYFSVLAGEWPAVRAALEARLGLA